MKLTRLRHSAVLLALFITTSWNSALFAGCWKCFGHRHHQQCGSCRFDQNCGQPPPGRPTRWARMEPPRAAVVFSVPAVMTAQQALAISPQEFRTFAVEQCRSSRTKEVERLLEALAKRTENSASRAQSADKGEPQQAGLPDGKVQELQDRIDRLDSSLNRILERLESRAQQK